VETKAHLCFLKKVGGAVGVYMEPRGRWTENFWEPLTYIKKLTDVLHIHYLASDLALLAYLLVYC
jgi:hypothetical protein